MNFQTIKKTVGIILCMEAAFMLPPLVLAVFDGDERAQIGFLCGILGVLAIGLACALLNKAESGSGVGAREGCVTVAIAWIVISLFGAVPYYASGVIPSLSNAVFETISGFSTTGATVLKDVESVPRAILLWRSITNWIGGMGVLVFLLAIAPVAREGGSMFLLKAEFPGPIAGKLVPRMQKSAKLLYEIYIFMTVAQTLLLIAGSVPGFDAVNIALSTVSTGGFSVKNDSLMSYSLYAQIVTGVFMMLCSISFSIFYCLVVREFLRIKENREFRFYGVVVALAALLIGINSVGRFDGFGDGLHHTLFQVISVMSTTAFSAKPMCSWSAFAWAILMLLMITGPMAGSTGGGMKLSRVMILAKSTYRAIAKTITPGSVHLVHQDGEIVDEETVSVVNSFAVVYGMAVVITAIVLSLNGFSFGSGATLAISSLGNVGLWMESCGGMSLLSKIVLCFDMFLGRLEFFPMLILFAPATWKK